MPISYKVIGRHIRDARQQQKLTQEALAEKLELSSAHLGKIERGERSINLERLSQLSLLLSIPIEKLVEGSVMNIPQSDEPTPSHGAFLEAISELTGGCSERTLHLMLRLCHEVAEEEKN